ncbi:MAG: hypothetical protein PHQ04_07360 [Opitutaceae bacterium]|nr:hypothetical protein [Opitutaceae bacterium]
MVVHSADLVGEECFDLAIRRAVALRRNLFKIDARGSACLVINSNGDGISGLTADRHADVLCCDACSPRLKRVHADISACARRMQKNGGPFDAVMCNPPRFVMTCEPAGAAEVHAEIRGSEADCRQPRKARLPIRHMLMLGSRFVGTL